MREPKAPQDSLSFLTRHFVVGKEREVFCAIWHGITPGKYSKSTGKEVKYMGERIFGYVPEGANAPEAKVISSLSVSFDGETNAYLHQKRAIPANEIDC